ncbi:MAG: AraC family transcriptional regulator [Sphingobium sp.]
MTQVASVRVSIVRAVLDEFVRRGGDGALIRRRYGLQPEILNDPAITVPITRYVAMFEDMAVLVADPLFGARIGSALRPADLGPVGLLISRSSSIHAALRRMTAYFNSLQSATQSHLSESDGYMLWTYRLEDPAIWPRRQDTEFTLTSLVQLLRAGFRSNWKPYAVHFEHAAPDNEHDAEALPRLLGVPVRFNAATNGLLLDAAEAHAVYRREDRDMVEVLERYLAELAVPFRPMETWRERVLALIASGLGQKNIRLDRLAADLGVTPRSLQRRLADEGTSLRILLNEHRAEIAARHLQTGVGSIASLAEMLGYADGTAFWRAHKRWIGEPPSARRAAAREARRDA